MDLQRTEDGKIGGNGREVLADMSLMLLALQRSIMLCRYADSFNT